MTKIPSPRELWGYLDRKLAPADRLLWPVSPSMKHS